MRTDELPRRWLILLGAFGAVALLNEAVLLPAVRRASTDDVGFLYVTLKFVLLPGAAFALLIAGLVELLRARTPSQRFVGSLGLGLGLLYLAQLWWRPLPWFAGP
jgi:hypothetical protein